MTHFSPGTSTRRRTIGMYGDDPIRGVGRHGEEQVK